MIPLETLALFVATTFIVVLSPGRSATTVTGEAAFSGLKNSLFVFTMKKRGFLIIVLLALLGSTVQAFDPTEQGHFDDPFLQITNGIAACPVQERAKLTPDEIRAETHWRSERGTSCYRAGRCRYPNAYLYDKELATRGEKSILADPRFATTSVWMEGYRRWVVLKGCVSSLEQSQEVERVVRNIDDVEAVINELVVLPN